MNFLHKRYKIAPQMENYDNLSCSYRPYMMFFNKENFKSKNVNTDENGFRLNFVDKKYHTNQDIISKKKEVNIIFGSSLVFGFGATNDHKTISSLLSDQVGEIFLNYGGTAFNSMQEFILFLNYAEKHFKIKRIIIISGINDLYLSFANNLDQYDNIFFNEKFKNVLKNKKRFYNIFNFKNQNTSKNNNINNQFEIIRSKYNEIFSLWKKLSNVYKFDLTFFLQPFCKWFKNNLSLEEKELFNILDNSDDFAHQKLKEISNKNYYNFFEETINFITKKNNVKYIDLNQKLTKFNNSKDWLFVDRVHMTDLGYLKISKEIINIL